MNTTERIVEAYFRHCLGCFTMTDVKVPGGNNRQLDLLAQNLRNGNHYHVETSVTHERSWQITWEKLRVKLEGKFFGMPPKREGPLTDFAKGKNYYDHICRAYAAVGLSEKALHRVWVTWSKPDGPEFETSLEFYCKGKKLGEYPIQVWSLRDKILPELMTEVGTSNYDDDVLRTLSLLRQYEYQTANERFRLR